MEADPLTSEVSASALGEWPGTDPFEAQRIIRGELGNPHLPFLAALPDRGPGSDALGRTLAMLVELPFDLQPHGWRLVAHPGKDQRRAESALSSDINALGDIAGAEEAPAGRIKIHLRGPLSLAANVHLHHGERALLDSGARREIYESLAVGAALLVQRVAAVSRGAAVVVQLDEPDADAVLAGRIPTASGYRTLRAIGRREATDAWTLVHEALGSAGSTRTVLALPSDDVVLDAALSSPAEALSLGVPGISGRQWERLAGALEAGLELWAGVLPAFQPVPQVSTLVHSILDPWQRIGLPPAALKALTLVPDGSLAGLGPPVARLSLTRVIQAADALNQVRAEG